MQDKNGHAFAGVIGTAPGGVIAVIGGEDDEVVGADFRKKRSQPNIEFLQRPRIPGHVAAVSVQHVKIHQVGKKQPARSRLPQVVNGLHAMGIRFRRMRLRNPAAGEDVADLADAGDADAGVLQFVQHRARRPKRIVVPVGRAFEVAVRAGEGPRNHASDFPGVGQTARNTADFVQTLQRDHVLMGGDLQDRIGRGVENGISAGDVFRTELIKNGGAAGGLIAEESDSGLAFDGADQFGRKFFKGGERFFQHDPGDFPMSRGGVLPGRTPGHDAETAGLRNAGGRTVEGEAEAEPVKVGRLQTGVVFDDVSEGVGPLIAVVRRLRGVSDPDAVQNNDEGSGSCFHSRDDLLGGWHRDG